MVDNWKVQKKRKIIFVFYFKFPDERSVLHPSCPQRSQLSVVMSRVGNKTQLLPTSFIWRLFPLAIPLVLSPQLVLPKHLWSLTSRVLWDVLCR